MRSQDSPSSLFPRATELERTRGVPLHAQITGLLREGIRSGVIPAATRLPSIRSYADELGLSRGVIEAAYRQLAAEGFLESRPRARAVVRAGLAVRDATPISPPRRSALDLSATTPDLSLFPRSVWLQHLRAVLRAMPDARLDYAEPAGPMEFRLRLAERLARVRGVSATAESVVATSGFTHGLTLVARALHRAGARRVAVEDPGFDEARDVLTAVGLFPVGVPVDRDGLVVDELARTRAQAVLVTPAHQFPTGAVLSSTRRHALVDWARRSDAYILEDDYDAEFRYDRNPLGTLQGLAPDRVVLLGSTAKTLAPALRIGWLVAPRAMVQDVLSERAVSDVMAPVLPLLAFASLLESGGLERHLRRSRRVYARRRDVLLRELEGAVIRGSASGMHIVIELDAEHEARVLAHLAEQGVRVRTLASYALELPAHDHGLVVGFGRLSDDDVRRAASLLRVALAALDPPRTGVATHAPRVTRATRHSTEQKTSSGGSAIRGAQPA